MVPQQSAWEIGHAFYNQRDLYTRDARIDAAGYGRGPAVHPEEGSYAYHRETRPPELSPLARQMDQASREAWPWLNYASPEDDPYFAFLRDGRRRRERPERRALLERIRGAARRLVSGDPWKTADKKLRRSVGLALASGSGLDARDIDVKVHWAVVALEGTVPDDSSRRRAAEIAGNIEGVRGVQNHLTVRKNDPRDSTPVLVAPLAAL